MNQDVVALVLAGGRMGDYGVLTQNRAKGALTFGGSYRIIDFSLSNLVRSGINRIGLVIQYLPASLIEHVSNGKSWDLDSHNRVVKIMPPFVGVERTVWYKGTADAVYQNLNFIRDYNPEHVIIVSGEHVYYLDYDEVLRSHRESDADVTVVTAKVPPEKLSTRFGYVFSDETGRIQTFQEKPPAPTGDSVSTGIFIWKTNVLIREVTENSSKSDNNLAKDILQRRVSELNAREFRMQGYWEYLQNVNDFYEAQMGLLESSGFDQLRHWDILTNLEFRSTGNGCAPNFGPNADVAKSLVTARCVINGAVRNSILSPGVIIEEGATVIDSIIMHDCVIRAGARLKRVICDRDVEIRENAQIGFDNVTEGDIPALITLLGKGVDLGPGVNVHAGAQIRAGRSLRNQAEVDAEI